MSKETYYSVKRDLLQCQQRPIRALYTISALYTEMMGMVQAGSQLTALLIGYGVPSAHELVSQVNIPTLNPKP